MYTIQYLARIDDKYENNVGRIYYANSKENLLNLRLHSHLIYVENVLLCKYVKWPNIVIINKKYIKKLKDFSNIAIELSYIVDSVNIYIIEYDIFIKNPIKWMEYTVILKNVPNTDKSRMLFNGISIINDGKIVKRDQKIKEWILMLVGVILGYILTY